MVECGELLRVGGRAPRKVDLRFVSATNRELEAAVAAGTFRRDLYYRLAGAVARLPPLRERTGELLPLAEHLVRQLAQAAGRAVPSLSAGAVSALGAYDWPGNVRELRNCLERALLLSPGQSLAAEHLQLRPAAAATTGAVAAPLGLPLDKVAETGAVDDAQIREALQRCGGNQTRAAALLGVSRRTL